MFLSRFRVTNYKCLGEIDIPLTPIHVLIGQNDSGKTSLLEAIAALYASQEQPLESLFPQPWSGRELLLHGCRDARMDFVGDWLPVISLEPARRSMEVLGSYSFVVDFHIHHKGEIRGRLLAGRLPSQRRCDSPQLSIAFPADHSLGDIHGESSEIDRRRVQCLRGTFSQVLKPAHKYSLDAKLMAVPAAIDPARKFRLDPDGFGLPTLLDDILGHDPERFLKLRSEFCRYFPQFRSVRIQSEPALARHYSEDGIHTTKQQTGKGIVFETQSGQTVRAQQASDGAILFLGFLALAHLPEPPTLLLIEEPENGIYPKRLGEVIALLKQLVHRTDGVPFPQIILSTHSPYVLSFFEPEEVTFLSRDMSKAGAPVRARPLRDAPHITERLAGGEFNLGELWYNLSEQELFGES